MHPVFCGSTVSFGKDSSKVRVALLNAEQQGSTRDILESSFEDKSNKDSGGVSLRKVLFLIVLETIRTGARCVAHNPVKTEESQRLRHKFVAVLSYLCFQLENQTELTSVGNNTAKFSLPNLKASRSAVIAEAVLRTSSTSKSLCQPEPYWRSGVHSIQCSLTKSTAPFWPHRKTTQRDVIFAFYRGDQVASIALAGRRLAIVHDSCLFHPGARHIAVVQHDLITNSFLATMTDLRANLPRNRPHDGVACVHQWISVSGVI